MFRIGVSDVELLTRHFDRRNEPTAPSSLLFRVSGIPVGRAELSGRAIGLEATHAFTREHAHRALRVAVAAWVRAQPGSDVFQLDEALAAMREGAAPERTDSLPDSHIPVTVAICSRDRPPQLERALHAIVPLLRDRDELLVVESAPAEARPQRHHHPQVRILVEPRPGLAWARNRALLECRSDVIIFTDDDCVPDEGWIDAHRNVFGRNPEVDVVTGLIEPLELATTAQVQFERYGGFARSYDRRWIHSPQGRRVGAVVGNAGTLGAGANFGIRRRLIERVGVFDAALGAGTTTQAGEELEFFLRALKAGTMLASEPRAVVRHEHRRESGDLERQLEGWSRGYACAIARFVLDFPEERTGYRLLQARIALLYHVRRALFQPGLRSLALAELRGMRDAARRYQQARMEAVDLAARIASATRESPPGEARRASRSRRQGPTTMTLRSVDLESLQVPLLFDEEVQEVRVAVRFRGRPIGTVGLRVHHGAVGVDRLLDVVLDHLGGALIRDDWQRAVRAAHQHFQTS
jgi:glycosyltransferase involved in cell wall biosynthesis